MSCAHTTDSPKQISTLFLILERDKVRQNYCIVDIFRPQGWIVGTASGYFPSVGSWVMVVVRITVSVNKVRVQVMFRISISVNGSGIGWGRK